MCQILSLNLCRQVLDSSGQGLDFLALSQVGSCDSSDLALEYGNILQLVGKARCHRGLYPS